MNNLFDMIDDEDGLDFSSFFQAPVVDTGKKKAVKAEKPKAAEKTTAGKGKSAGKDFDVSLPVTVRARGFSFLLEESGTLKASELVKRIFEDGYQEISLDGMNLSYEKAINTVFVTEDMLRLCDEDSLVLVEDGITVADGNLKCVITADMFDGYDADEISADMIMDKWLANNPQYAGFSLAVAGNVAYPTTKTTLPDTEKLVLPCAVFVNGNQEELSEEMFLVAEPTVADLVKKFVGELTETKVCVCSNADKSMYFISYKQKKYNPVKKGITSVAKAPSQKVERKYLLPLNVRLCNMGGDVFQMTEVDFPDKKKVSEEEVIKFFGNRYRAYADKSRKVSAIYIEEENLLSLMILSGEKGAYAMSYELLRTQEELMEAMKKDFFHGTFVNHKVCEHAVRVENISNGIFLAKMDSESGEFLALEYKRKLPKIPKSLLDDIVAIFKRDLSKEDMYKICYNKADGTYFLVHPQQTVTKVSVSYEMPSELLMNSNIIPVMEIHSHNTMPAFFSSIDDRDEIMPGLYGVIGRLDSAEPQMKFRAGFEGIFKELSLQDIWEV